MQITETKKHFILCVQWQNSMHYHANDKTLTSIAPSVEFASHSSSMMLMLFPSMTNCF